MFAIGYSILSVSLHTRWVGDSEERLIELDVNTYRCLLDIDENQNIFITVLNTLYFYKLKYMQVVGGTSAIEWNDCIKMFAKYKQKIVLFHVTCT